MNKNELIERLKMLDEEVKKSVEYKEKINLIPYILPLFDLFDSPHRPAFVPESGLTSKYLFLISVSLKTWIKKVKKVKKSSSGRSEAFLIHQKKGLFNESERRIRCHLRQLQVPQSENS